jgi:hypothetical protein
MSLNEGFYRTQEAPITKLDALIEALRRFRGCDFDVAVKSGEGDSGVIVSINRETDESRTVILRIPSAEAAPAPRDVQDARPAVFDPTQYPEDAVQQFTAQLLGHWFAQGGEAQFGPILGGTAEELIASILQVVRKQVTRR